VAVRQAALVSDESALEARLRRCAIQIDDLYLYLFNLRAKRGCEQKKIELLYTQNCRILRYVFVGNLPPKKYSPSFKFFTFPPTFSRRHLLPSVSGVDAPGHKTIALD